VAELTDPWFALFVASQSLYLVVNLAALVFLYARETNLVDEVASGVHRPIHVLVPVRGERRDVLAETVDGIFAQAYPDALTHVYVVYEVDDAAVESYLDSFLDEQRERGRDVVPRRLDREALSFYLDASGQLTQGSLLPRTKAAALVYAFVSLTFERDDVITVFDSDTQVPSDTFALAVGGLEEYDIVQAKQTVRNIGDGWLPRLESMGIAAWSHDYSARGYAATRKAVEFENRRERLVYYLLSNPVTQVAYATIWTVPILYALRQAIRGEQPTFEVTPK
jgi:cellulose synthase/poly-beta-1,6-N-acetylglucosamine synthase-like glycosyltransferase